MGLQIGKVKEDKPTVINTKEIQQTDAVDDLRDSFNGLLATGRAAISAELHDIQMCIHYKQYGEALDHLNFIEAKFNIILGVKTKLEDLLYGGGK